MYAPASIAGTNNATLALGEGALRKEFLYGCKSRRQARKLAPWAADYVKVDGGYMAFESMTDADTFRAQH